jgi:hypothetical protein
LAHAPLYRPGWDSQTGKGSATLAGQALLPAALQLPCTELNAESFESNFGIWIDGGSNCSRTAAFPNTGTYSVQLRNGVGITSSMYTQNQNFVGVAVNVSFSYYPQGYETGEGFVLEYATDGGTIYTGYAAWVRGNHFENNNRYDVSIALTGMNWTSQSRLRLRSVGNANDDLVYIDDVVIKHCCEVGASCNDNNACTINDVFDANCQCHGTFQDADNDGTCDAFDICPGVDDYLVISEAPCDDGDPCTVYDHLESTTCGCAGQYIDWDQDGYCQSEDPDDLDACNPDPENPACNPCITHDYEHFESSFGDWSSGGNDCSRLYAPQYANGGNYCVRIRDNNGAVSSMYTNNFNLAGLSNVSVAFSFKAVSMETNEDFILEVSTNGGSGYSIVESWNSGSDFQNNTRYNVFVPVTGITWTSQTRFRIRCDASANDDAVYIDDIYIKSCQNYPAMQSTIEIIEPAASNDHPVLNIDPEEVLIHPNPASEKITLDGTRLEDAVIDVFSVSGSLMQEVQRNANTVDISQLNQGMYFLRIYKDGQVIIKRFVKQ